MVDRERWITVDVQSNAALSLSDLPIGAGLESEKRGYWFVQYLPMTVMLHQYRCVKGRSRRRVDSTVARNAEPSSVRRRRSFTRQRNVRESGYRSCATSEATGRRTARDTVCTDKTVMRGDGDGRISTLTEWELTNRACDLRKRGANIFKGKRRKREAAQPR